ncbi:unnamed protein product [Notodromas monacha]|uniref:Uncharacterized protein n=1 Tax=Notodromas monacha TaxID=399045 RepID=A0A7R9BTB8_9CRUS|nr:unnamed protein product [Notodromas monacha]CAG0919986.1 unnamed protein product [Notodromas monacha]
MPPAGKGQASEMAAGEQGKQLTILRCEKCHKELSYWDDHLLCIHCRTCSRIQPCHICLAWSEYKWSKLNKQRIQPTTVPSWTSWAKALAAPEIMPKIEKSTAEILPAPKTVDTESADIEVVNVVEQVNENRKFPAIRILSAAEINTNVNRNLLDDNALRNEPVRIPLVLGESSLQSESWTVTELSDEDALIIAEQQNPEPVTAISIVSVNSEHQSLPAIEAFPPANISVPEKQNPVRPSTNSVGMVDQSRSPIKEVRLGIISIPEKQNPVCSSAASVKSVGVGDQSRSTIEAVTPANISIPEKPASNGHVDKPKEDPAGRCSQNWVFTENTQKSPVPIRRPTENTQKSPVPIRRPTETSKAMSDAIGGFSVNNWFSESEDPAADSRKRIARASDSVVLESRQKKRPETTALTLMKRRLMGMLGPHPVAKKFCPPKVETVLPKQQKVYSRLQQHSDPAVHNKKPSSPLKCITPPNQLSGSRDKESSSGLVLSESDEDEESTQVAPSSQRSSGKKRRETSPQQGIAEIERDHDANFRLEYALGFGATRKETEDVVFIIHSSKLLQNGTIRLEDGVRQSFENHQMFQPFVKLVRLEYLKGRKYKEVKRYASKKLKRHENHPLSGSRNLSFEPEADASLEDRLIEVRHELLKLETSLESLKFESLSSEAMKNTLRKTLQSVRLIRGICDDDERR